MNRLDIILENYEKERKNVTTLKQLQEAANKVVEKIESLPGEKTQIEHWILALFKGLSQ